MSRIKLTLRNAIIDLLISVSVYLCVSFFLLNLSFSAYGFFTCGKEYLTRWEDIRLSFAGSILLLAFQLFSTYYIYTLRTIVFKVVFWIGTAATFIAVVIFGIDTFTPSNYYEDFNAEKWKTKSTDRLKMVRTFNDNRSLIGKSKSEILKMLGGGYKSWNVEENQLAYYTEGYASPFVLTLKNDTVVSHELECHD